MQNILIHSIRILVFILLISLVSSSCSNTYYDTIGYNIPTEATLLSISERKEVKVSAAALMARGEDNYTSSLSVTGNTARGFEKENAISLSAAYGLNNRFAIQGNFMFANEIRETSKQQFFQQTLSFGTFFKRISHKKRKGKEYKRILILDAYVGMGYGDARHQYSISVIESNVRINFLKGYIHGGLSFDWGRYVTLGLSTKLVYTNYLVAHRFNDIPDYELLRLNRIKDSDPFIYLEFSPKLNFGTEYASFYVTSTGTPYSAIFKEPPGRLNLLLMGLEFNVTEISDLIKKRKGKKKANKALEVF